MEYKLPEGYVWQENKGLVREKDGKKISNAIPILTERQKKVNVNTGKQEEEVILQYLYSEGHKRSEMITCTETEIRTGAYMKKCPLDVVIEMGGERKVAQIYTYSIRAQLSQTDISQIIEEGTGWVNGRYYWGADEVNISHLIGDKGYSNAVQMAVILAYGNDVVNALVLAAVHGTVKQLLIKAGISHDFVTYIVGKSGIGKSYLSSKICNYLSSRTLVFSLGSDRKELQRRKQNMHDITVVLDDFNRTKSSRVKEKQLQTLSEIIQSASDSGKYLIDEKSTEMVEGNTHIVVTAEERIDNISTLNRCYMVEMEEELEKDLSVSLEAFFKSGQMKLFMYSYICWIQKNYGDIVRRFGTDYTKYANQVKDKQTNTISRIENTLAVQLTISKTIVDFLKFWRVEDRLVNNVAHSINQSCNECSKSLQRYINKLEHKKSEMKCLIVLTEMICDLGNHYHLAKDEDHYLSIKFKGKIYLGFCKNQGYISFLPKRMCMLIANELQVDCVAVSELQKELKYFSLAHIDSEGKMSNRWGTDKRMYHVRVRDLLDLFADTYFDHSSTIELFE